MSEAMLTVDQTHSRLFGALSRAWTTLKRTNWRYLIGILAPHKERRDLDSRRSSSKLSVIGLRVAQVRVCVLETTARVLLPAPTHGGGDCSESASTDSTKQKESGDL